MDKKSIRSEIDSIIDTFPDMALLELLYFLRQLTAVKPDEELPVEVLPGKNRE